MGCCYSVRANFVHKDNNPSDFCNVIKEQREEQIKLMMENSDSRIQNLDDPLNCFQILTGDVEECENGIWYSDFDASYSWSEVLEETFAEALKVLECGSFVEIGTWADEGEDQLVYIISLGDGDILTYYKDFDYEDEEYDDDDEDEDDEDEEIKDPNEKYPYWVCDNCYTLKRQN